MAQSMLRSRAPGDTVPVTSAELFFDLVFVFAVTQLSHTLLVALTWIGVLHVGLLLLAVWWAWIYTVWCTNWLDPDHPGVRAMLFALMAVGLVLSASLPRAFHARALPFAVAYALLQMGRNLFMVWAVRREDALRRNFVRVGWWLTASAALWIGGALAGEDLRLGFWIAAVVLEYASPALGFWTPGLGRSATTDWTVEGGHMAERCSLFIIICLGESVLMTGATFAGGDLGGAPAAAFATSLAGAIAMWWIYFNAHAEAAAKAIRASRDPGRIARTAYTYAHIPMVAGVIVTAAANELALAHPLGAAEPTTAALILGGPALFLAGALWFKQSVFGVISLSRSAGLALLAATAFGAHGLSALGLSAAAASALVVTAVWESLARTLGEAGDAES